MKRVIVLMLMLAVLVGVVAQRMASRGEAASSAPDADSISDAIGSTEWQRCSASKSMFGQSSKVEAEVQVKLYPSGNWATAGYPRTASKSGRTSRVFVGAGHRHLQVAYTFHFSYPWGGAGSTRVSKTCHF